MSDFFNVYSTDETEDKLLHKRTTEICVEKCKLASRVFSEFDLKNLSKMKGDSDQTSNYMLLYLNNVQPSTR